MRAVKNEISPEVKCLSLVSLVHQISFYCTFRKNIANENTGDSPTRTNVIADHKNKVSDVDVNAHSKVK